MQIIHFTHGATDALEGFRSLGVSSVPLADGAGDTHVTCLHFGPNAVIHAPPVTHDSALLIVSGRVNVLPDAGGCAFLSAGMGVIIDAGQHYSLKSQNGAIAIAVESQRLRPTARAISTPERIMMTQCWPGEK